MARPRKAAKLEATTAEDNGASTDEINAIEDRKIFDYITGKPVAENDKERVRQRIARALFHEYGISVDDMEPDFKVKVDGSNKKIDIAISTQADGFRHRGTFGKSGESNSERSPY
jgi:type I restriction enzyme M protein